MKKRKCARKPKCHKPQLLANKIDFMAGFVSLGIVFLCAYTLAVTMIFVNSV